MQRQASSAFRVEGFRDLGFKVLWVRGLGFRVDPPPSDCGYNG